MAIPPPPYQRPSDFIKPTYSADITIDPVALTAWGDKLEQGEKDFPALKSRLDALTRALDVDDWCAPRVIDGELHHLNNVLSGYHCAKYLNETLQTLDDAEADLGIWRTLPQAARDERWAQWTREKIEAQELHKKKAEIRAKQNAFYTALSAMGISPIPMAEMSEPGFQLPESSRKIHELELQISNMGNHLYE